MKKWKIVTLCFFCLFLMVGCNDDNDDNVSPDSELVGSWVANYSEEIDGHDCVVIEEFSFLNDGTFSFNVFETCEDNNDYEDAIKGTWEVRGDFLYVTFTEALDPEDEIGIEFKLYYFIASTGELAITSEDEHGVFTRIGSGTGIVGEWESPIEDDGCQETIIFNSNGTFSSEDICPNPDDGSQISGTYNTDGDILNATFTDDGSLVNYKAFYKIFGSELMSVDDNQLFSKD